MQNKEKAKVLILISHKGECKVKSIEQDKRKALLLKRYNLINKVKTTIICMH